MVSLRARTFGRLAILVTALAGGACVDYSTEVFILYNRMPDRTNCTVPAGEGDYISRGTLDLQGEIGYTFTPVLRNMAVSGDPADPSASTNAAQLRGANTTILATESADSQSSVAALAGAGAAERGRLFSGRIEPGGGTSSVAYQVIDDEQAQILADDAVLQQGGRIEVVARTRVLYEIDSRESETEDFDYPISLCVGCITPDETVCDAFRYQF